jgi:hypothetical protein
MRNIQGFLKSGSDGAGRFYTLEDVYFGDHVRKIHSAIIEKSPHPE